MYDKENLLDIKLSVNLEFQKQIGRKSQRVHYSEKTKVYSSNEDERGHDLDIGFLLPSLQTSWTGSRAAANESGKACLASRITSSCRMTTPRACIRPARNG